MSFVSQSPSGLVHCVVCPFQSRPCDQRAVICLRGQKTGNRRQSLPSSSGFASISVAAMSREGTAISSLIGEVLFAVVHFERVRHRNLSADREQNLKRIRRRLKRSVYNEELEPRSGIIQSARQFGIRNRDDTFRNRVSWPLLFGKQCHL